jgi:hypothetical protein
LLLGHVPLTTGEEVTLIADLGAPLSGTVTVDGVAPGAELSLRLSAEPSAWGVLSESILKLGRQSRADRSLVFTCDPLGRFRVRGLPPSWSGRLHPPEGLRLEQGGASLVLEQPRTELQVALVTQPVLHGVVVGAGAVPVSGADVRYELRAGPKEAGGPSSSQTNRVTTREDGTFAIPLGPAPPKSASLSISAAGVGVTSVAVELEGLVDHDLGTIRLFPLRSLAVRVLDTAGAPLAGAVVHFEGEESAPTGPDGLTRLDNLPLRETELLADALGFARTRALVPRDATEPFEVTLRPMASLFVSFIGPDGEPGAGLTLSLSGGTILEELDFDEALAQLQLGASTQGPVSVRTFDDGHQESSAFLVSDKSGQVHAVGLVSGTPIHATVRDASGAPLPWEADVTLTPGEKRELEVVLPAALSSLSGRVVDEAGAPVYLARIMAWGDEATPGPAAKSDRDGHFTLGPLLAATTDVWVESYGFAPAAILGHVNSDPLEVILESGFELRLLAKDATGKSWPVTSAKAAWHGRSFTTSHDAEGPSEPGRAKLSHLPQLSLQIEASVLGCTIEVDYQGAGGELSLAVPTPGQVRLTCPPRLAFASDGMPPQVEYAAKGTLKGHSRRPLTPEELERQQITLTPLLAGSYDFRLAWTDSSGEPAEATAEGTIAPDSTLELTLAP